MVNGQTLRKPDRQICRSCRLPPLSLRPTRRAQSLLHKLDAECIGSAPTDTAGHHISAWKLNGDEIWNIGRSAISELYSRIGEVKNNAVYTELVAARHLRHLNHGPARRAPII